MTSPLLPHGFWTITRALNYLGEQRDDWTGKEYLARQLLPPPEEAQAEKQQALKDHADTARETENVEPPPQFDPDPDDPEYTAKYEASVRLKAVSDDLFMKLHEHNVHAFWWNASEGRPEPVPGYPWLAEKYQFNFDNGTVDTVLTLRAALAARAAGLLHRLMLVREAEVKNALAIDHPTGEQDEPSPQTAAEIHVAEGTAQEAEPDAVAAPPNAATTDIEAEYARRVNEHRAKTGQRPTFEADDEWRKSKGLKRDALRDLRRQTCTEVEKKGGHPLQS